MNAARLRGPLALGLLLSAATGLAVRPVPNGRVRLEVGAFTGDILRGEWSRSLRADVDLQATADGRTSFYYRAAPPNSDVDLPLVARGPLFLTLRGNTAVRGALGAFVSGERMGEVLVRPGSWDRYTLQIPDRGALPLAFGLALRPLPLVRGAHGEHPEWLVDYLEVEAPQGLTLSLSACILLAAAPLVVVLFSLLIGVEAGSALATGLASAVTVVLLARWSPLPVILAAPRLVPVALWAGLAVRACLRRASLPDRERAALAWLMVTGVLFHGSIVFFPDHSPPDIDIHVRRTLDLGNVPLEYDALLRYGSQLPTASQDMGQATVALGERTLIPYSPLPYLFYYGAHRLGLNLYWAMTVLNVVVAMAVAPWMFVVVDRLWNRGAAWVAALLYTLDLAVWHHLGRSHAPAVFGSALGTAALLYLALHAQRLDTPRRVAVAGLLLGVAVLGYSSLVVLVGLFGCVLLLFLLSDARDLSPAARRGVAGALVVGGLVAGGLFYFHYVPGLLQGAPAVEAEPDHFPGRTFLIFHNESRQSLRLWALGYAIPLVAGLCAAPLALRRVAPSVRAILFSWLLAWALIMFLKEPFLFPKLLRWAKEDQFLSPLLCVFVAGAVWALPRASLRWGGAAVVLGAALWLQLRDFAQNANSLRL